MENAKKEVLKALQEFITTRESIIKTEAKGRTNKLYGVTWTLTQLHIVALIKQSKNMNNTNLAKELKISKPAVTKAIRKLLEHQIIMENQSGSNKKAIFYSLTNKGDNMAFIHEKLHEEAESKYLSLLEPFQKEQLETIITFLNTITSHLKNDYTKRGNPNE